MEILLFTSRVLAMNCTVAFLHNNIKRFPKLRGGGGASINTSKGPKIEDSRQNFPKEIL